MAKLHINLGTLRDVICTRENTTERETAPVVPLTDVVDRQLGHHGDFVGVAVAPHEAPHLGVLGLEAGLPQPLEVDGVDGNQTSQSRVQHVRLDQAGDVTWTCCGRYT